ncbi:hypothetical protein JCM10295v2_004074 [Rhodotorula toruloides]
MLRKVMRFWASLSRPFVRGTAVGNPQRKAQNEGDEDAEDPPVARERATAPSPFSLPQRKKEIPPTLSPLIERAESPAPSPTYLDLDAENEDIDNPDSPSASAANSSIWSSISHRALLLARAKSRLPSLRLSVSRRELELEEARRKLEKQERVVERRKERMRREMRRALGGEKGAGKVGKDKKEKEGKKRRKGKKRAASPEL